MRLDVFQPCHLPLPSTGRVPKEQWCRWPEAEAPSPTSTSLVHFFFFNTISTPPQHHCPFLFSFLLHTNHDLDRFFHNLTFSFFIPFLLINRSSQAAFTTSVFSTFTIVLLPLLLCVFLKFLKFPSVVKHFPQFFPHIKKQQLMTIGPCSVPQSAIAHLSRLFGEESQKSTRV